MLSKRDEVCDVFIDPLFQDTESISTPILPGISSWDCGSQEDRTAQMQERRYQTREQEDEQQYMRQDLEGGNAQQSQQPLPLGFL